MISKPFEVKILTMFPEAFPGPLGVSIIGTSRTEQGLWDLELVDLKSFSPDRRGFLDDTPAGGGAGQVMRADIIAKAVDAADPNHGLKRIYLSARGESITQQKVREWAMKDGLLVLCGRFEGVDQRVIDARGFEEVTIGDAVLAGGEAAALVLIEAIIRLIPGVLGAAQSLSEESFENDLLEHPQFTRPRDFENHMIPEVLLKGDHKKIAKWRKDMAIAVTKLRRPDLWASYVSKLQPKGAKPQ
jgi:tRNA (guanine37-N1)-methyltransferase